MLLLIYAPHAESACLQCSKHKSKNVFLQRGLFRGVDTIISIFLLLKHKIMKRLPTLK
jgi:hypothetical protein